MLFAAQPPHCAIKILRWEAASLLVSDNSTLPTLATVVSTQRPLVEGLAQALLQGPPITATTETF